MSSRKDGRHGSSFSSLDKQQTERTSILVFVDCFPSEYDHEVGMMTCTRAELKRLIGAVYAVMHHDCGSRENALTAGAWNHPSRHGVGRSGTGGANIIAHTPWDNGNRDTSKKVRRCRACRKRGHLKRDSPMQKTVVVATVVANTAGKPLQS